MPLAYVGCWSYGTSQNDVQLEQRLEHGICGPNPRTYVNICKRIFTYLHLDLKRKYLPQDKLQAPLISRVRKPLIPIGVCFVRFNVYSMELKSLLISSEIQGFTEKPLIRSRMIKMRRITAAWTSLCTTCNLGCVTCRDAFGMLSPLHAQPTMYIWSLETAWWNTEVRQCSSGKGPLAFLPSIIYELNSPGRKHYEINEIL